MTACCQVEIRPILSQVLVQYWESLHYGLKKHSLLARLTLDTAGYLLTKTGLLEDIDTLWGEDFSEEEAQLGIELLVQNRGNG